MPGPAHETGPVAYRPLLFSIAHGMTGSVGDVEDKLGHLGPVSDVARRRFSR